MRECPEKSRRDVEVREILLARGKVTIVDDADYNWLSQWKWHISSNGYARRKALKADGTHTTIRMHAQIIGNMPGLEPDHINGNRLDNRRSNLRHVTHSQNLANQKKTRGTSLYKGVDFHNLTQKWQARAMKDGKRYYIGLFATEANAALAYNEVAIALFGEFARLNQLQEEAK